MTLQLIFPAQEPSNRRMISLLLEGAPAAYSNVQMMTDLREAGVYTDPPDRHTLKGWDASSGDERLTLDKHRAGVFGCAFSPDGARIASAAGDNSLRVWDAFAGGCLATLYVDGCLSDCAWSPMDIGSRRLAKPWNLFPPFSPVGDKTWQRCHALVQAMSVSETRQM